MKMIILGAGATAYSYYANPKRRPPLSTTEDFSRMFTNPVIIRPAIESHYAPFFTQAIKLYNGDIERLFTELYFLVFKNINPSCEDKAKNNKRETLKQLCSRLGNTSYTVTYKNILTIFKLTLFDEIRACIPIANRISW